MLLFHKRLNEKYESKPLMVLLCGETMEDLKVETFGGL